MLATLKKGRFALPALLVGASAVGALITAAGAIPTAQAESGRRICAYKDENAAGNHLWNVMDYKKGGECPRLYSPGVQSKDTSWKKITCEDFAALLGEPSDPQFNLKPDPCPTMVDDHVYEIVQDQGTHVYSATDKGSYVAFQRSVRFHAYPGVGYVYRFCATTFDAQGNELDRDCDMVGVGGTSRLFYRPGTTKVSYTLKTSLGKYLNRGTVIVATGDNDARNYCVDRRYKAAHGEYTRGDYC